MAATCEASYLQKVCPRLPALAVLQVAILSEQRLAAEVSPALLHLDLPAVQLLLEFGLLGWAERAGLRQKESHLFFGFHLG